MKKVVAFDIGCRNFAFAQVRYDTLPEDKSIVFGDVIFVDVHDFSGASNIFRELICHLDRHRLLWEDSGVILVEQQLNAHNIHASRIACHVVAYFYNRYPDLRVIEYPSIYKTRYLGADRTLDHKGRKRFAVETVLSHYKGVDPVVYDWIMSLRKQDDVADCILMCATFPASPFFTSV